MRSLPWLAAACTVAGLACGPPAASAGPATPKPASTTTATTTTATTTAATTTAAPTASVITTSSATPSGATLSAAAQKELDAAEALLDAGATAKAEAGFLKAEGLAPKNAQPLVGRARAILAGLGLPFDLGTALGQPAKIKRVTEA
ncbi:MAG: hypothetical protein ABI175_28050, partial [Polyangiales bacterium]